MSDVLPAQVGAIDWGSDDNKRWMVRAFRSAYGPYRIYPPEPVGDPATLLQRLREQSSGPGSVLVGFDFPIGLPAAYARRMDIVNFKNALRCFGESVWDKFY